MNGFAFQKHCRFEYGGVEHQVQRINADKASIVAERTNDGQICCLNIDDLLRAFSEGSLEFLDAVSNTGQSTLFQRPISELNDSTQRELDRRLAYVTAIREAAPYSITPEAVIPIRDAVAQKIGDDDRPSFISLYRWVGSVALHGDFRALIPRYDR